MLKSSLPIKSAFHHIVRLVKSESGQATAEYALLLGISGAAVASIAVLGDDIKVILDTLSSMLQQVGERLQDANTDLTNVMPR